MKFIYIYLVTAVRRQWSLFTFMVSTVTPGNVFKSEDLEVGASNEREHAV